MTKKADIKIKPVNVEMYLEDAALASIMVPLDDPYDPNCRFGIKSCFWGPSGIGKSDIIKQSAARAGLECRVIVPGQRQPEDFGGVPVQDREGNLKVECLLRAVRDLNKIGKGVIFVDEASTAPPAVQGAMLTMVNDGVVGDTDIAPAVRMLLAANPPEMSAGGWGFEPPFANRVAHFYTECPSVEAWAKWLMADGETDSFSLAEHENRLRDNWTKEWATVRGLLVQYQRRAQKLHEQPPSEDPSSGYAWPSPRTWVLGGRAHATIRALKLNKILESMFMAACVGEGHAREWYAFLTEMDLPSPEDVLFKGWTIDRKKIDRTHAVCNAFVMYTKGIKDKQMQLEAARCAWERLFEVHKAGLTDITVTYSSELIKLKLSRENTNADVKAAASKLLLEIGKNDWMKLLG